MDDSTNFMEERRRSSSRARQTEPCDWNIAMLKRLRPADRYFCAAVFPAEDRPKLGLRPYSGLTQALLGPYSGQLLVDELDQFLGIDVKIIEYHSAFGVNQNQPGSAAGAVSAHGDRI